MLEGCLPLGKAFRRRVVLAVKKVLRALIFLHLLNFETERYTQEMHGIKSLNLQEIYEFDFSFFVLSRFVQKLQKFKKIGARNTFLTAVTCLQVTDCCYSNPCFKRPLSYRRKRKNIRGAGVLRIALPYHQ